MFSVALSQSISPPVAVFPFCLLLFSIIYRALFVLLPAAVTSFIYPGSQPVLFSRDEALGPPRSATLITAVYLRDGMACLHPLPFLCCLRYPQSFKIFFIYFHCPTVTPCLSLRLTSHANKHDRTRLVR